ncbi:hypothetical protein SBADM41S_02604 [Streptomyces badius]
MPEGVEEGIVKGLYRFKEGTPATADAPRLELLAAGTAIHWALEAQELLAADWGVTADVLGAPPRGRPGGRAGGRRGALRAVRSRCRT